MEEKIDELIRHYFKDHPSYEMEPVPFGLTNLTKLIRINEEKYIARIYNPHTKSEQSIRLESNITSFLSQMNLSFKVPVFLQTLTGEEYIEFADGTFGALIAFLEGSVPELTTLQHAADFGRVVGEISAALDQYNTDRLEYRGISFLDIYALHPLASVENVKSFMEQPPFHIPEANLKFYREMILLVNQSINQLKELPFQLVHHDLLIFNLLAKDNQIGAVLDFDFTSIDVSFMELAISLNHVLQMADGNLVMTEAFIKGYGAYRKGSSQEIKQLQLLTQVYHLAILHIYIGQHYAGGQEVEQNFNYILNQFFDRNEWLNQNQSTMQQLLESYIL
ncbi:Ser/Thr protein kinase RdoA (MazF antagonist) [Paenibacillus castaneae]|uniref:phosphotransferase n=1 Tax=Paenibacillus castaneae TaxID=474957 RepID=UPI00141BAFAB|nr:phosphotransferase [Paenibacillus castaneae]NIK77796.1 Ser/Thr protein kinase RdoA (MazF antagonist) [Paenibacillus castaneae]